MYALRGYKLRGLFLRDGNIAVGRQVVDLPDTVPGSETKLELVFTQSATPMHVQVDVLRPNSFSAYCLDWNPLAPRSDNDKNLQ
jgi:hypothetical protein